MFINMTANIADLENTSRHIPTRQQVIPIPPHTKSHNMFICTNT